MAQRCKACLHHQRQRLDAALLQPHVLAELARQYGVSRPALFRHRDAHIVRPEVTPPAPATEAVAPPPPAKKLTPQEAFLTCYSATADLKAALKEAGIGRVMLRKWQEHDEKFQLRYHQAEVEAVENLEAEARIRAVAGSKMVRRVYRHGMLYEEIHEFRPSDAMLVKLLQAAKPEKYGERLTVTQTTVVKAIADDAWEAV